MKCPIDQTEMEKGILVSGFQWVKIDQPGLWKSKFFGLQYIGKQKEYVYSYRCPKCGKVELTTEVK